MTLYEIDHDATRRRIDAITAGGLRAMGELRERAESLDKSADEMFQRQEREKQAMDERVRLAAKEEPQEEPESRPKPKRTLSLGAEEFHQAREARKAKEATPPPPPEQDKPVRKPRPRPEGDDDMSGRTWLR